jgi:hypothetical protein
MSGERPGTKALQEPFSFLPDISGESLSHTRKYCCVECSRIYKGGRGRPFRAWSTLPRYLQK